MRKTRRVGRTRTRGRATTPVARTAAPPAPRDASTVVGTLALIGVSLLVYIPALWAGWVWDDREYVWGNPLVLGPAGLRDIWLHPSALPQYYPVVFTLFWLQHALWGLNPFGYHLVNVLLHGVNACLVWGLLRRLGVSGAFVAAAVFAVHPVQVETVAWVTELKNVLSGTLALFALRVWIDGLETRTWRRYWLGVTAFVAGLLSKTAISPLPLVMLALAWWRRPTEWRRTVPRLVPFVLASVALGAVTLWREPADMTTGLSPAQRCLLAGRAVWFYVGKLLWPADLMTIYPRWPVDVGAPIQYSGPLAIAAVLGALWSTRSRIGRGPLVAVAAFVAVLAPSLGLQEFSFMLAAYVADHFQYLASVSVIALGVAGLTRVGERLRVGPAAVRAAFSVLIAGLALLTWRQAQVYRDEETLWRAALTRNPQAWVAHWGLGQALQQRGSLDEALEHFRSAAQLQPDYGAIYYDWGQVLDAQGHTDDAIAQYRMAVRLSPRRVDIRLALGNALARSGQVAAAIDAIRQAAQNAPEDASTRYALGGLLLQQGQLDAAAGEFAAAVRLRPGDADLRTALAVALLAQGRLDAGIEQYRAVVRLKPDDAEARQRLEAALAARGTR